jgi:2'-5' RNA ligase
VPPEQWHITLAFYGEVPPARIEELTERLSRAVQRTPTPIALRLSTVGTFPKQPQRARVLWVGLDGDVGALSRLAGRCAGAARRVGLTMEDRAFRPHLTLARARGGPADLRARVQRLAGYAGRPWRASEIHLVHSTLGAAVRHETIGNWALPPTPPADLHQA